ncbi:MAG: hypothetical protein ABIQ44_01320 [Chloroflexia bacterium]
MNKPKSLATIVLTAVVALLLAGLLIKVAFASTTVASMFQYPFQFDESEGMIVAETMLMDQGVPIFNTNTPAMFIAAPYPPVFYLLCWPFQHLLGDEPSFKIGRAISILATLTVGAAIFGIVYRLTRSKLGGAVGALLFWSLGLVTFWGSLVKPDMLALALGLVGVWWAVARPPSQVWWCLIPLLLAFYTKQTGIASAVAVGGWLLFTRPKVAAGFGAAYAAGAIIPSVLLNWWTNGGYFYHQFTLHSLPWFADRTIELLSSLFIDYGAFLLPGAAALAILVVQWITSRTRKQGSLLENDGGLVLILYLGMSLAVASGTGTLGGNHNHLLDLAAACCLGVGAGLGVALGKVQVGIPWRLSAVVLGVVALCWVPSLFGVPVWLQLEFNQLKQERTKGMMDIFQYVTNNPGEAYSDNVGLMIATRKRLWSTDPYTQTHATFYKRWDESLLVAAIKAKEFSQVILRVDVDEPDAGAGDVSPGILQAVQDNYKLDQRNVLNIYVPK